MAFVLAWRAQHSLLEGRTGTSLILYTIAGIALLAATAFLQARGSADPNSEVDARRPIPVHLGSRRVIGGVALTLGFAAALTGLLLTNIAHPLGGWLWAATLATLILTFNRTSPSGASSLLIEPGADFFGPGTPRPSRRVEIALALLILAVAIALRVAEIETLPGIFGDEGERGMNARAITEGHPAPLFGQGWWAVPNLYFHCLAWMLRIFGDDVTGVRTLSVICGTITVMVVYRIGRLLWGPRAGLIAGSLMAVSPLALQFSRLAGESTPTGMLWAGGFLFFFRALRARLWVDWAIAGFLFGLSLYFYAAGKLIIPLLGLLAGYAVLRWRRRLLWFCGRGFLLLGLAFALTFLPYAIFCIQDDWYGFFLRARETSIFTLENRAIAFDKHGIPPPPTEESALASVVRHPLAWGRVISEQLLITMEVLYRRGDRTPFYQINLHSGTMLAPLWAALAMLGVAYAGGRVRDARFALLSLWFLGGILAPALTTDTPSVQRLTGAWPALMLFPAVLLDRVAAAAWPLNRRLARSWATVPLVALLAAFGVQSYREYFHHYAALCPYCSDTVQARFVQTLGPRYKVFQLGVGEWDIFFGYGSTRFVAKNVEGVDVLALADLLPPTDLTDKGAAFLVYPHNAQYLPLLESLYPGGRTLPQAGRDGQVRFTAYLVPAPLLERSRRLRASFQSADGAEFGRDEAGIGTGPNLAQGPWQAPPNLVMPAGASWSGGLVAPSFGRYQFRIQGPAAKLELDGRVVLEAAPAREGISAARPQVEMILTKGLHEIRFSGTLAASATALVAEWALTPGRFESPEPRYLYRGPTGGLSAEIWSDPGYPGGTEFDSLPVEPPLLRRSDAFIGLREAATLLGGQPALARWHGTLTTGVAGDYRFQLASNGPSRALIDGRPAGQGFEGMETLNLSAGTHEVDLRYLWREGRAHLEWFWIPPGGTRSLVPPTALRPAARSWRGDEISLP